MEVVVCTHSDLYLEAVLSIDVWTDVALAVSLKPTIVNSFASCSDEVDIKSLCDVCRPALHRLMSPYLGRAQILYVGLLTLHLAELGSPSDRRPQCPALCGLASNSLFWSRASTESGLSLTWNWFRNV